MRHHVRVSQIAEGLREARQVPGADGGVRHGRVLGEPPPDVLTRDTPSRRARASGAATMSSGTSRTSNVCNHSLPTDIP
jgi:hypothetical protein